MAPQPKEEHGRSGSPLSGGFGTEQSERAHAEYVVSTEIARINSARSKAKEQKEKEKEKQKANTKKTCCKPVKNIKAFVIIVAAIMLFRGMLTQYLAAVIEKVRLRYNLKTAETDFLFGVEKIGFVVSVLFVAHYSRTANRPRVIMAGTFLTSVASIIMALPFFLSGSVLVDQHEVIALDRLTGICQPFLNATDCNLRLNSGFGFGKDMAFLLICLAELLAGIGTAMFTPIAFIYIEDNGLQKDTSLYMGTLLSMNGLGEFIGIILATRVLEMPEHFGVTDIQPDDPRWLGAWWIGFPIFSVFLFISSLLVLMFPKWFEDPSDVKRRRARRQHKKRRRRNKTRASHRQNKTKHSSKGAHSSKNKRKKEAGKGKQSSPNGSKGSLQGSIPDVAHVGGSQPDITQGPEERASRPNTPSLEGSKNSINSNIGGSKTSISGSKTSVNTKPTDKRKKEVKRHKNSGHHVDAEKRRKRRRRLERLRKSRMRSLPSSLMKLLRNPTFLLSVLGGIFSFYLQAGFFPTLPRFLQLQFHRSFAAAWITSGVSVTLASTLGLLFGSILVWKMKMTIYGGVKMMFWCTLVCSMCLAALFALRCPQTPHYGLGVRDIKTSCDGKCDCEFVSHSLTCGADGVTYPSPCHAGCEKVYKTDVVGVYNFANCTCVQGTQGAISGSCSKPCILLIPLAVIVFVASFAVSLGRIPGFLVIIRSVKKEEQSIAIGFAIWLIYLFAFVPGSPIFDFVRRSNCILKQTNCNKEEECWIYNLTQFTYIQYGATVGLEFLGAIFFGILCLRVRFMTGNDKTNHEDPEKQNKRNGTAKQEGQTAIPEETEIRNAGNESSTDDNVVALDAVTVQDPEEPQKKEEGQV